MKIIYKYRITFEHNQTILIPSGGKILHVDEQEGEIYIWIEVDTSNKVEERKFTVFGTGNQMPEEKENIKYQHLGTVKINNGALIWHIYETLEK